MDDWIRRHATPDELREARKFFAKLRKVQRGPTIATQMRAATNQFWREFYQKQNREDRIVLLRRMAEKKWRTRRAGHRERFDMNKQKYYVMFGQPCKLCSNPSQIRHHIIPLMHGGGNHGTNLVRLCKACHGEIHGWLKEG